MSVNVGNQRIKITSVFDTAHISDALVGASEIICFHSHSGQKNLADVSAVNKA